MKNRCAILLVETPFGDWLVNKRRGITTDNAKARVYGSHSEAKKQLPKWLSKFPDAELIDVYEVR